MIALIDNYDSFTYNLYQLVGSLEPDTQVFRNDAVSVDELAAMAPEAIILSPGPGRPDVAGICEDVVKTLAGRQPILGVCLGHQAICEAMGGKIIYARELMHGKKCLMKREGDSILFDGLPETFFAARYHSLAVDAASLPENLHVTAISDWGEVMAVEDPDKLLFGVQFHPESIMTTDGETMMKNFLNSAQRA